MPTPGPLLPHKGQPGALPGGPTLPLPRRRLAEDAEAWQYIATGAVVVKGVREGVSVHRRVAPVVAAVAGPR